MTIPRQLAPTMGHAHGGVEFLKGSLLGFQEVRKFPDEEELVWKELGQPQVISPVYSLCEINSTEIRVLSCAPPHASFRCIDPRTTDTTAKEYLRQYTRG